MAIKDKKLGSLQKDIDDFKTKFEKDWGVVPNVVVDLKELMQRVKENK